MKLVVWKYPLQSTMTHILMPFNARVLSVATQDGTPCIWVLVDADQPSDVLRRFLCVATGEVIDYADFSDLNFIGTVQWYDYRIVQHVFEVV